MKIPKYVFSFFFNKRKRVSERKEKLQAVTPVREGRRGAKGESRQPMVGVIGQNELDVSDSRYSCTRSKKEMIEIR